MSLSPTTPSRQMSVMPTIVEKQPSMPPLDTKMVHKKAKTAKPALTPDVAALMAEKFGVTADALLKTLDASRDQARATKVAAREAAKKAKELHKSQMSREQLVTKFGEAEADAELTRRNAKALKAREELKTKAKEWHWLTAEVARLKTLCDAYGVDHTLPGVDVISDTTDAEASTAA